MKNLLKSSLFAGLLLAAASFLPAAEIDVKPVETGKCFLWTGEAPSGARVCLLGSVHMGKTPYWPFDNAITTAWREATVLALELDMNDEQVKAEAARLLFASSMIPDGKPSLSEIVGPEKAKRLDEALRKSFGCSLSNLERMRPWCLNMTLVLMACQKAGWTEENGVDRHLAEEASAKGLKIVSLETPSLQVDSLSSLSDVEMGDVLLEYVEKPEAGAEELNVIVSSWRGGDAAAMERYLAALRAEHASFVKGIVDSRNAGMADGIAKLCQAKGAKVFVAVGAAHLVGPEGVVALLKKRGFALEQAPKQGLPANGL